MDMKGQMNGNERKMNGNERTNEWNMKGKWKEMN